MNMAGFLEGVFGEGANNDVEVTLPTNDGALLDPEAENQELEEEEDFNNKVANTDRSDVLDAVLTEAEVVKLLLNGTGRETTTQCFNRLTNSSPRVPFCEGEPNDMSDRDRAEHVSFCNNEKNFQRWKSPGQPGGCLAFERLWDAEVARRFQAFMEGDADASLIERKSCLQLQQHCDCAAAKRR